MRPRRQLTKTELREALRERLRYLAFKARREPKALTLPELDELCEIVAVLSPKVEGPPPPEELD